MKWQVQKWAFLLGFQYRKRALACPRSGLFNFRLLFAPANYLEIVLQIRDFRGDCLNFWLFIKKGVSLALRIYLLATKKAFFVKDNVFSLHLLACLWNYSCFKNRKKSITFFEYLSSSNANINLTKEREANSDWNFFFQTPTYLQWTCNWSYY